MCGIIGYVGKGEAIPKMTEGLSVLEYRGYDSVGIAADTERGVEIVKCRGRVEALKERLSIHPLPASGCAIGHTRWATHGGPSDVNAHPHRYGRVILVHNGIIENEGALRGELMREGAELASGTDSEVAAAWLDRLYTRLGDPLLAIAAAEELLKGSYAFAILFADRKGEIYAVRRGSPLLLAKGADGYYLASDLTALLPFTKEYLPLSEGEVACLREDSLALYGADGKVLLPSWQVTSMTAEAAQRGGYPHFMLKEIYEQPDAILQAVSPRVRDRMPDFSADGIDASFWEQIHAVHIVACGSAMHAGLVGARVIEDLARVPTGVYIASEYRYHPPVTQPDTLVVIISQSGETADSLAALRAARETGLSNLAIVNGVETSIAREADRRIYTYAGPEIAVATTKGYCTQVAMLYLMGIAMGYSKGLLSHRDAKAQVTALLTDAPEAIRQVLRDRQSLHAMAQRLCQREHAFYIGRGMDYAMSLEAALKLKEISYIQCEAYAAGELKHGTISLIEEGTPVLAISTDAELSEKMESNVREVQSRGACVLLLCRQDAIDPERYANAVFRLPTSSGAAALFGAMAAVQLIAYETAVLRGCDVDRPRNLAKSVTVE